VRGWNGVAFQNGFSRTFLGRYIRKYARENGKFIAGFNTLEEAILKAKTLPIKHAVGITHTPAGIDGNLTDVYTIRSGVVGGKGMRAGTLFSPHFMNHRREEHAWINCNEGEWGHNVIGVDAKLEGKLDILSVKIDGKLTRLAFDKDNASFSRTMRDFEVFRVDDELTKAFTNEENGLICYDENFWSTAHFKTNTEGVMCFSIIEKKEKKAKKKLVVKEETQTPPYEESELVNDMIDDIVENENEKEINVHREELRAANSQESEEGGAAVEEDNEESDNELSILNTQLNTQLNILNTQISILNTQISILNTQISISILNTQISKIYQRRSSY